MIKGGLQNRQEPEDRLPRGAEKVAEDMTRVRGHRAPEAEAPDVPEGAEVELAELKRRIEACRDLRPPKGIHDGASWGHGRDAVIQALTAAAEG